MTKHQLLSQITGEELAEWMALWSLRADEREAAEWKRKRHG